MHRVFLALGTNLGEREQNLANAVERLGQAVMIEQCSPIYETEPWGVTDQPSFLNQVVVGRTMLDPHSLLVFVKRIEGDMGREQGAIRWGPRLIDIDIVFYDNLVMESSELTIPHPRLEGRAFVLAPLVDLDPDYVHPALGITVTELLEQCDLSTVTRVTEEIDIVGVVVADVAIASVMIDEPPVAPPPPIEEIPPSTPIPAPPRSRRRLPPIFWILVMLLALLLFVGIGSIGYYILLTVDTGQTEELTDVWGVLDPAAITPGLAIWTLTDIESDQVYRQAMANDDLASATSVALTTPDLPDTQRLGWLLVLARRYAIIGNRTTARRLLELAADIAILEPELADYQRAEALVDVAQQWSDLGEDKQARKMLDNATLITQKSTTLSPPLRQQILGGIAAVYASLDDFEAARAIEALSSGGLPTATITKPPDPLAPLNNELGYPDDLARDIARRKAEAQAFVDSWIASGGQVSRGQVLALEAALIDEDIRRTAFYQQQLSDEALGVQQRALVLWDQAQWLIIKRRIADGLMGISLVPNWEAERPAIRQTLHDVFVELQLALTDSITLMLSQQQRYFFKSSFESSANSKQNGLYPDADQIFLGNAMNDAVAQWPEDPGIVPVAIIDEAGEVTFGLAPAGQ